MNCFLVVALSSLEPVASHPQKRAIKFHISIYLVLANFITCVCVLFHDRRLYIYIYIYIYIYLYIVIAIAFSWVLFIWPHKFRARLLYYSLIISFMCSVFSLGPLWVSEMGPLENIWQYYLLFIITRGYILRVFGVP